MTLIYCYDAYCPWSFGFISVLKSVVKNHPQMSIEILNGGMIVPNRPIHIQSIAEYFLKTCDEVQAVADVKFGQDFLWHIQNPAESDWFPNSIQPAVASYIMKRNQPYKILDFIQDVQTGLFVEGRDLTDKEAYRHLVTKYDLEEEEFYQHLNSDEYLQKIYEEFEIVKQLRINSFPTLLLQSTQDTRFFLVSKDYQNKSEILKRIDAILNDIRK